MIARQREEKLSQYYKTSGLLKQHWLICVFLGGDPEVLVGIWPPTDAARERCRQRTESAIMRRTAANTKPLAAARAHLLVVPAALKAKAPLAAKGAGCHHLAANPARFWSIARPVAAAVMVPLLLAREVLLCADPVPLDTVTNVLIHNPAPFEHANDELTAPSHPNTGARLALRIKTGGSECLAIRPPDMVHGRSRGSR